MAKKRASPELSESELRRLLMERRRQDRKRRFQAFQREGEILPLDSERAEPLNRDPLASPRIHADRNLQLDAPPSSRRKWLDRLLLLVETLAVLGLVIVFLGGLNLLNELNTQVASFFEAQPTPSATPILQAVVLPSGHTPPNEAGGARPNEAEIPAHLRPQQQTYTAALNIPTPGPQQARRIQIDALQVNAPIVQGDGWEELKRGVGQHIGTGNPGQSGNMVLSGHNDIFGEVFRNLDQLEPGDEIVIYTDQRPYTYLVTSTMVVEPTFVQVMAPTLDPTLTLISCYPYLVDTQRIVVQASLQSN